MVDVTDRLDQFEQSSMRVGWKQYRKVTDERLRLIKQLGVDDLLLTPWRYETFESAMPEGDEWTYDELITIRNQVENADLRLFGFETMPIPLYDILLDEENREEYIKKIKNTIRNMGEAEIPVLGYSGHPPSGVGRTTKTKLLRGGAQTTAFNADDMEDPDEPTNYSITEEDLWEIYEEYLKEVLPVAEEAGVTLAVHPSDPPVKEIDGVPLLFRNFENFKRSMEIVESDNHGLKLCLGCWSEMGADIPEVIRYFGEREKITYIHFRDVVGTVPKFYETFLDDPESNYDEVEVVRTLMEIDFDGILIPDHVPLLEGEDEWQFGGPIGRSFTVGYIRGLIRAVGENRQ